MKTISSEMQKRPLTHSSSDCFDFPLARFRLEKELCLPLVEEH
jgi:hypothetical protein